MGLTAAVAAWRTLKDQRDAGGDPTAEKRATRREAAAKAARQAYTVASARAEFLRAYKGTVAPKTFAEANRLRSGAAVEKIEQLEPEAVTRAIAFATIENLAGTPVQAANLRRLLGAVWDRALDAGRLQPDVPNWWRLIMRGRLQSRGKIVAGEHQGVDKRVLSEAELGQLLPWLPNFSRDVDDALTLMMWTCCRGAEVVAMHVDELEVEGEGADKVLWWTIPRAKLKMRRNPLTSDLRVPLVGRASAVARRRREAAGAGFIFPGCGRSGHIEQKALGVAVWTHHARCELRPEWQRPRLPVADWAPHDLRRTGRTLLSALGCPGDVGEAILGHMLPGQRGTYDRHRYDAERRRWLELLALRLEQIARRA